MFGLIFLLSFFPHFSLSDSSSVNATHPQSKGYVCKVDQGCWEDLNHFFLDKEDRRGIYQHCRITYENIKLCCIDPSTCEESYGKDLAGDLRKESLSRVEEAGGDVLSCELNRLSQLISSLSSTQAQVCELGVENCKTYCENQLEDFKREFRRCFSIPDKYSIEEVLKKGENPPGGQEFCYKAMGKLSEKYKKQSLSGKSLLREEMEARDIVKCEEIRGFKTKAHLNNFALGMCQRAQVQKEELEDKRAEEEKKKQSHSRENGNPALPAPASSAPPSSEGKALLTPTKEPKRDKKASQEKKPDPTSQAKTDKKKNQESESTSKAKRKKAEKNPDKNKAKTSAFTWGFKSPHTSRARSHATQALSHKGRDNPSLSRRSSRVKTSGKGSEKGTPSEALRGSKTSDLEKEKSFQVASVQEKSSCPISPPKIKATALFQSVEAPQIEPMKEQKKVPYNDYDLVKGKPAGVLVHLDRQSLKKGEEYVLDLVVFDDDKYHGSHCFHSPFWEVMREGNQKHCSFKLSHLKKEGDLKFFPLEDDFLERDLKNVLMGVTLYPRKYGGNLACFRKQDFRVNTIETESLDIAWTRIDPGKSCKGYSPVSIQKVKDFSDSDEIDYILSMFPIASIYSSFLKDPSKERSERTFITAKGSCNAKRAKLKKGLSVGFLRDALNLGSFGPRYEFHKVFVVVPSDYFIFHRIVDNYGVPAAGAVLRPTWEDWYFSDLEELDIWMDFLGGSWNAAFVREDQLNQGTVAHELAHTLGQSREYYEQENKTEYCRPFNGESSELCQNYQIPQALYARKERGKMVWEFVEKRWSIMNNEGSIKNQWIDRETH